MNFHLNQDGRDVGVFPLEELRRRRDEGELTGAEPVWTEGMEQWQALNTVLRTPPRRFLVPPLPPGQKKDTSPVVVAVLIFAALLFVAGMVGFGVVLYRGFRQIGPQLRQLEAASASRPGGHAAAMKAASRPVSWTTNTPTWGDVNQKAREFRFRQYVEGYRLRGERNPECDLLSRQFLTNWIASNYGGTSDTNLPSLTELSDRLASDPACRDPLVLTVAAVNAAEGHEANLRLERAVKGFENSKHQGYPKFYAVITLVNKLDQDQTNRLPVLDAQAMKYVKAMLTDGSILPGDQPEIGELFVNGWGEAFFQRHGKAIYTAIQERGDDYQWLALVLEGENEINLAWRARGNGWANQVSATGVRRFADHLAAARSRLERAWQLRPDLPLAPYLMMKVALGESGIAEMREWFDRATAAQLDYAGAWDEMRWGLRPRWYGTLIPCWHLGAWPCRHGVSTPACPGCSFFR